MKSSYLHFRAHLAMAFMNVGAVLTAADDHPLVVERKGPRGIERGFKLKHHEKNPDAPLSPIRFNLRMPPLTVQMVDLAARCLRHVESTEQLQFDAVVGIPKAGDPFATALARLSGKTCLPMKKEVRNGERRVTSLVGTIPKEVRKALLVDDVITTAGSKLEAIDVLRSAGLTVSDVIVVIDREQGGREELQASGCKLHSVFTVIELLNMYAAENRLPPEMYSAIRDYLGQTV